MKDLLFWERYRPRKMEDMVLPERITNHFKNGLNKNVILYGDFGTGKTSLARILIGKYRTGTNYIEVNSSLYTSIDLLRNEIEKFCKSTNIIDTEDDVKYVFLDEYERVSAQFEDAFKAFSEKYKHVRFILTTNHYNKVSKGIKSRFTGINFNFHEDEKKDIQQRFYKKLKNICANESITIDNKTLADVVKKNFPDMRSMVQRVQDIKDTGTEEKSIEINTELQENLYKTLFEKDMTYNEIYHFVMDNFGDDNIDVMFQILSRPFVDHMIEKKQSVNQLFKCNYIITDTYPKLETNADPIIVAMTTIGRLRDILTS